MGSNKEYFKISPSVNPKVIGKCDIYQIDEMIRNYNFKSKESVDELWGVRGNQVTFQPDLNGFKLHKNAKLTDIMGANPLNGRGVFVNEKTKQILEKFNLADHYFFETKIYDHKEMPISQKYYWFHLLFLDNHLIDYNKSTFQYGGKPVTINGYDDYIYILDMYPIIYTEKTVLKKEAIHFDVLLPGYFDQKLYFSENLIKEFELLDVIGFEKEDGSKLDFSL
ncbi:hypothetical protein [Mangrovivirga cuniculi]|uniref:Immunity protein 43 domain-containing protein n=1 Tax=Mangrovivirga cuniculi TaxID=2715131 RepID=A0A4D7JQG3_9BACT|nr:hypothetical protein [Mangrovivirga cuniculi]QCK13756.1 hypothetical protein DCC35_02780 [Mangrovivirga cuniculi]